jgi:hypothetical protein
VLRVDDRDTARVQRQVSIEGPGEIEVPVILPPATTLRVEIPALHENDLLDLRLVDEQGREHPELIEVWHSVLGEDGALTLDRLPAGAWTVEVTAKDGREWTGGATTRTEETTTLVLE